jgi:DNA polymerase-3 subunit gamma/tau
MLTFESVINKYRPRKLFQILGQDTIVNSLNELFEKNKVPHGFMFIGNSGLGKTTLSRIIGNMLEAELVEIDGATYTGVDDMREIKDNLKYRSFTSRKGNKLLILDECQHLSQNAWSSWLKFLEEPPGHVYFCFCTTEGKKVPTSIKNRCNTYQLKDVDNDSLRALVEFVSIEELGKPLDSEFIELIVYESDGSPRQALSHFSEVAYCGSLDEAIIALRSSHNHVGVIDLCRLLMSTRNSLDVQGDEQKATKILSELKSINPESVRIQICKYFDSCVLNSKDTKTKVHSLEVLEVLNQSFNHPTGFSNLMLAIFQIIFNKK